MSTHSNNTCPKCESQNIEICERGFALGRAIVTGNIFTPIIDGAVGLVGRKNLVNRCMDCGKVFKFKPVKQNG